MTKKLILEPTVYYVPIYCYRHWPSSIDIYDYIVDALASRYRKKHKIILYTTEEAASKAAHSELCDDDCCAVAVFDFTYGYVECGLINYNDNTIDCKIRPHIDRWSNIYEVVCEENK